MTTVTANDFVPLLEQLDAGASEKRNYEYRAPNGRWFNVRWMHDGRYFLEEYRPNGRGDLSSQPFADQGRHVREIPELKALLQDGRPSEVWAKILVEGWENNIIFDGAGLGIYTRYFDSLDACAAAVNEALASDTWYRSIDEDLKQDADYQARLKAQEDQARKERATFKASMTGQGHGLFKGAHTIFSPLPEDTQKRILSYLNEPTPEKWDAIAHHCIAGFSTLWQAWIKVDPAAPRSLPSTDAPNRWPSIPDPDVLRKGIRALIERELAPEDDGPADTFRRGPRP